MKFYIRRNNNKVDSIETGRIVIVHLFLWNDQENCMYSTLFQLLMIKFYRHHLVYKYNFVCSLFWTAHKLTNDKKLILILREISTFRPFERFSFQLPSTPKLDEW